MKDEQEFFVCSCGALEHQFVLSFYPDEEEMYLQVHMTYWEGFWRRLWAAIRYVLGFKSKYGDFDEIILDEQAVRRARSLMRRYLECQNIVRFERERDKKDE